LPVTAGAVNLSFQTKEIQMTQAASTIPEGRRNGANAPGPRALTPIRCLIVDDHPAIRAGLRYLLAAEAGFEVLDALASAEAAAELAERTAIDVAIVDYQLDGRSGLWLSRILKRLPDPPGVLIYSAFSDYLLAAACVVAEADGLLSKAALADSMRRRLDTQEQAIFGLLLAGIPRHEIARTLGLAQSDLEARQWAMLRKLERLEPAG
jgi:DNA-binding NarL/FixJ family response regulator